MGQLSDQWGGKLVVQRGVGMILALSPPVACAQQGNEGRALPQGFHFSPFSGETDAEAEANEAKHYINGCLGYQSHPVTLADIEGS